MWLILRESFLFGLTLAGLALPFYRASGRYPVLGRLSLSLALALVAIYLFATVAYLARLDYRWHWLLPVLAGLAGWTQRHELPALVRNPEVRSATGGWFLLTGWCLGLTALITSYAGGGWAGDWHEHFERTCFFLEHWPDDYRFITIYLLPARPPLANLLTGSFLALGPLDFPRYQIITCLLSTLSYFPLLALAQFFGGGSRTGAVLTLALMASPAFVQNATFPWTKLPVAFFVLAALPFLLRTLSEPGDRRHFAFGGLLLAAGVLTHYSAAVWGVALGAGWLWAQRPVWGARRLWLNTGRALLPAVLLLATWFGWAFPRYGTGSVLGASSTATMARLMRADEMAVTFVRNLVHTLVPHPWIGTQDDTLLQPDSLARTVDWFFHLYQETLPLTLGFAGLLLLFLTVMKIRPSPGRVAAGRRRFWSVALSLALLLGVGTHTLPNLWGLAHISLLPLTLLALAWLIARLPGLWPTLPAWTRGVVVALLLADVIGGIVLHFVVQHEVVAHFAGLSFAARSNYAGKLRLGQPFLADSVATADGMVVAILAALFGLALWRAIAAASPPDAGQV
ncbi:MAG: hypothetical protein PHQ04_07730 [Opitutaceae bacterium]|nr:hypothetical protein [Opitutaceae bacterium]